MQASPTTLKSLLMRHSKGKIDMILEPMQVMVQLAILSFSPLGTKISIHDNIVILQQPTTTHNNDNNKQQTTTTITNSRQRQPTVATTLNTCKQQ